MGQTKEFRGPLSLAESAKRAAPPNPVQPTDDLDDNDDVVFPSKKNNTRNTRTKSTWERMQGRRLPLVALRVATRRQWCRLSVTFFPPKVTYALTRTTNSPSIHPTTQRLCAQQQNTIVRPRACARNSDDRRVLIVIDIAFVTTAPVTTASIQQRLDSSSSSSRTQFQFGSVALRPGPAQNRR